MFIDVSKQMLYELSQHHREKETLQYEYITKRLNESLNSYYKQLQNSSYYIKYNTRTKRHKMLRAVEEIR